MQLAMKYKPRDSQTELERVLRGQIERLSDVGVNHELHNWWNWDPAAPLQTHRCKRRPSAFSARTPEVRLHNYSCTALLPDI